MPPTRYQKRLKHSLSRPQSPAIAQGVVAWLPLRAVTPVRKTWRAHTGTCLQRNGAELGTGHGQPGGELGSLSWNWAEHPAAAFGVRPL